MRKMSALTAQNDASKGEQLKGGDEERFEGSGTHL